MLLQRDKSQLLMVDMQERLLPAMSDPATIVRNGSHLLEAARTLTVPVLVSEQYPAGLGRTVPELANLAPANAVHEKVEFSCFANPALNAALSDSDRQTVIFGIEAHVCVLQSAIEMAAASHDVTIVVDAIGSRAPESKEIALRRMQDAGVRLATTEMILFEWLRRAGTPEFKTISRLIR
ncbi:MAG TPA: isochorismatase family protein [Dongiaceae bacterium]|jgi:nicotinamidase-related amidase|nr:isochorismatase family protein [Dongiaceae bacterium]